MRFDLAAARRVHASYGGEGLGTSAYVAARLLVAPLAALGEAFQPLTGSVLSLGSGLGVVERYLAEVQPDLTLVGVDLDADKVDVVARTRERAPRVELRHGDAVDVTDGTYDAVLVCDLLHHLDLDRQGRVAEVAAARLRPGGVCVVKDLDVLPRWKHEWNRIHDRLVAGPEPIHCRPPADVRATFEAAGLEGETSGRIDRPWTPYAHYLVTLRRPA
jgi:SAM-dependent methyltransferase